MIIDFTRPKRRIDFSEALSPYQVEFLTRIQELSDDDLELLRWKMRWKARARNKQLPPLEWLNGTKSIWGIRSGRGFGKTLTAAETVAQYAMENPGIITNVIAPTYDDARYVCFEGPTGLANVIPARFIATQNKALPSLTLTNGSYFRGFAADSPDRLRGPQCHVAWGEEIASWRYAEEAWSNIEFGLRLGKMPRMIWTGTPRPTMFMKKRSQDPRAVVVLGSTYENRENLTQMFYDNVAKYEGTKIGRQELYGELIDPEEASLVQRSQWRLWPAKTPLPKFRYILYSLDTAFTEETFDKKKSEADPTACSVWGLFEFGGVLNVMLLDCWEDYLGLPALIKRVKKEKEISYGDADEPMIKPMIKTPVRAGHQGRKPDMILIEEKGSGISLRQSLAVENILTHPYNPGQLDKLSRLHIVTPMFAHARVWAVESEVRPGEPKTWADPLITQVCTYVGAGSIEHDDLLDTTTQALRLMVDQFFPAFTVKPDQEKLARMKAVQENKQRLRKNPYGDR